MNFNELIIKSWVEKQHTLHTRDEILAWIAERNETVYVRIKKINLSDSDSWFYDNKNGEIRNKNASFFQIAGFQKIQNGAVIHEQPIIIQNEIGYLGIICKEFDGVLHFLMQAKIEPGNTNKVQISPTVQATKSNFTQKHGGTKPAYLEYFIHASPQEIVVDQIQSEQSSRFYQKRNRNIIIMMDREVELLPSHKWMTLAQIKDLFRLDNLVNMDTRTVLSCIPFYQAEPREEYFTDKSLYRSIFNRNPMDWPLIYHRMNNYKMFDDTRTRIIPLDLLSSWKMSDFEISCQKAAGFKVIYCDIEIEGREVKRWTQPLFEATGKALFGLFTCNDDGIRKFLIKLSPEIGCFDKVEWGPTVQIEADAMNSDRDDVESLFLNRLAIKQSILNNTILSEEGGRFYHEENQNVIINIEKISIKNLPDAYLWVDYRTLNQLVQTNNCLNIQLRNLLSLLEV